MDYQFDYPKLEGKVAELSAVLGNFELRDQSFLQSLLARARHAARLGQGIAYFRAREEIFDLLDEAAEDVTGLHSDQLCYNCKAYRRSNCDHNHYAINN